MTTTSHHHDLRASVAAASRTLAGHGLLIGTAGNVSVRAGDVVAVTATGVVLGEATVDDVTVVDLDGTAIEGDLAPTSELALHLGVLRSAPAEKVSAVVHTHAPNATALSLVLDELPVVHYQQLVLGGSLRVAPFHAFGTPELAAAVGAALEGRLAALMANHGTVALGPDLQTAVEHALLVEWLAELYLRAATVGTPRALDAGQQQEVVAHAMRLGYGTTKPVPA
ncbi:class II aldolase/adducin family protein [Microbacterium oleivorans]|uniref:class II aldolase/adducin family protein n=1 Tax=Microbacterium oleivorans TaxID=273677 RepID=UPI00080D8FD9|nr:class II aldolase/adducin family protein [Microbacterium oleivorans]